MGFGDNLMATGLARGAAARGKRIAFGDGQRIIWDKHSATIFDRNPNIALPGTERKPDIEWIAFHKGARQYNSHDAVRQRWVWNYEFRAAAGEMFFSRGEQQWAELQGRGFVVVEPNVPEWKSSAANKAWPSQRYDEVTRRLTAEGIEVVQFAYGQGHQMLGARMVKTPTFRDALAVLSRASLFIGAEGGLHHGAAAVGLAAVVLFGGFVPPAVTGYATHTNLTGGAEACGSLRPCAHCRAAMDAISVDEVVAAAMAKLKEGLR